MYGSALSRRWTGATLYLRRDEELLIQERFTVSDRGSESFEISLIWYMKRKEKLKI